MPLPRTVNTPHFSSIMLLSVCSVPSINFYLPHYLNNSPYHFLNKQSLPLPLLLSSPQTLNIFITTNSIIYTFTFTTITNTITTIPITTLSSNTIDEKIFLISLINIVGSSSNITKNPCQYLIVVITFFFLPFGHFELAEREPVD